MATTMTKSTAGIKTAGKSKQYLKTGGMVNKNAKAAVQMTPGSKGVGTTKSKKLSGAIPSKKMGGSYKKGGMKRGC